MTVARRLLGDSLVPAATLLVTLVVWEVATRAFTPQTGSRSRSTCVWSARATRSSDGELGGSVTYGGESLYPEIESRAAPRNDETIDYYLERRLNREFPSKRWEVINAGVGNYNTAMEVCEEVTVETHGFEARVLQHELDHLDGILILDRVASTADLFARKSSRLGAPASLAR